ncbi:Sensor histidine kinase regulating citrate/malate metabolism [Raineyella antarctica]|uniref:histidine kinase n=1 Tax=Raineyella antarctica TaxID=1577474 RepID=A0A1G6H338_9ACTN|nr:ATP-binding protein [Raineyella antarctica]SDB88563.1 Sensor histidine kinase regulating citrate/malate metabolism [Raineyella antarctica]
MHGWSLARRLAVGQMLGLLVLTVLASALSYIHTRETVYRVEGDHVLATARLLAQEQEVRQAYATADPSQVLQPLAVAAAQQAEVSWVTFMDLDGTRLSHWLPNWVGTHYPGRIAPAVAGTEFVETSTTGTAGPSVRAVVPIRAATPGDTGAGQVIGVVSVGQRVSQLDIAVRAQIPTLLALAALVGIAGALASWALKRYLDRVTFGLGPEQLAQNFTFLDTALHNVNVGIVLLGPGGRLGLYNDRAAELLGLPTPSASTSPPGKGAAAPHVDDLHLPLPLAELLASRREARDELFSAGDRILVVNQHRTRTAPRSGLLPWRRPGLPDADNGSVVTLYDRTDVQHMNRELESTRSLTEALRSQTHEHANRLHTVLSLLELGRADRARELLSQGLETVGTPSGTLPDDDAEPAVSALLVAKSAQARERGVRMDYRNEIDSPTGISGRDLVTLLGNLLDNAIDAAADPDLDPTDRWVDAQARLEEDWLVLEVTDGGDGPSAADADRIFDLGWSTKPAGPAGRGMGLALVRQTARQLGGDVEVARDSGTVFTVEVPTGHRRAALVRSHEDDGIAHA